MQSSDIKIGDYIRGQYKYGCIHGIVTEIHKKHVVINVYQEWYNERRQTQIHSNVTISRIREVNPVVESGTIFIKLNN